MSITAKYPFMSKVRYLGSLEDGKVPRDSVGYVQQYRREDGVEQCGLTVPNVSVGEMVWVSEADLDAHWEKV